MQTPDELIPKLKEERWDLQSKIVSLELYLMNEEYQELPPDEKNNLWMQYESMTKYSRILLHRITHQQELKRKEKLNQEAEALPKEIRIPPETWEKEN